MTFSEKVDTVFEILEDTAKEQNPSRPLFSRIAKILLLLTGVAIVLAWAGLELKNQRLAWTGTAILTVVVIIDFVRVFREVRNPGVTYSEWTRAGAKRQAVALEKLHALPGTVLQDSELYLRQRVTAAEEALVFLVGPLRTLGLAGGLSALLAVGAALENWIPVLKNSSVFVWFYSAFTLGLLLGAERGEAGLMQLRSNRDLVARAIALQQKGSMTQS